jgi:glycosyltransferase involved in cell wall biosynthesis
MKVSLITVTYNSASTVSDTLKSVYGQTYPNIEHIIIDGSSTDQTLELIREYNNQNITLVSEPDQGIYDAMNKGVQIATGDIIGIINSDDVYQDQFVIQEVVSHFESDPHLHIVYGDLLYVKSDDMTKIVRKWKSKSSYSKFFEHGNVPPHPTVFLKKKVYSRAGFFDLRYRLASDYEFMLRVFKRFDFKSKYVPRIMVRMRLGGETNKSIKNIINGNKEIIAAWKNNGLKFPLFFIPLKVIKRLIQFI